MRPDPGRAAVPLLLLVFVAAGAWSLSRESATFDETTHLPAGYTYLDRLDFRHNPEHPPLAKMWAALPLRLARLVEPDYASPHWVGRRIPPEDPQRSRANQWLFGHELLYGRLDDPVRRDPQRLLVPARLAILALGLLLCLVVYAWAHEIWGLAGARIALLLCCLSPAVLAHARYVTTDLAAALGFASTLWCFRRWTLKPAPGRAGATGLALGAALLCKYTTLLLLPMVWVLGLVWCAAGAKGGGVGRRLRDLVLGSAIALAVVYACLWAGYGFRYSAVSDPDYRLEWEVLDPEAGPASRAIAWARDARWLPEAYLYGLAYARGGARYRLAFLNGEESVTGWWYYFPEAFLLKTPLAFLALLAWVVGAGIARTRGRSLDGWFLTLATVGYFALSMSGHLNIGHRHLLPVYPILCVAAGGAAELLRGSRAQKLAAGALLAGCAASFVAATPGYLAYFNFLAGGSKGGWRYLVDSNIDWGQDLPQLRRWMEEKGIGEVHLAYFGTTDPRSYGIRYRKVVMVHDFHPEEPPSLPGPGDIFAVSVTLLQGVYVDRDRPFAEEVVRRGWIAPDRIRERLREADRKMLAGEPFPRLATWAVATGLITEAQRRDAESALLPTLLDRVRETLEPVGRAGDSILIYRLP